MTRKQLSLLLAMLMSMAASIVYADTREYVDLGLPSGTLWATCNVGADNPGDYGDLFTWREIGNIWGAEWCMPSLGELEELVNSSYTTTTWTGWGYLITSKVYTDRSIFLPAAGCRYNTPLGVGSEGLYWSNLQKNNDYAYCLYFKSGSIETGLLSCRYSLSVRLVRKSHVPVTDIALSPSSLSLAEGESAQLTATLSPSEAAATALTWRSSDTQVATVGSDGLVVAVAAGSCTITCETTEGSGLSATCAVTVKEVVNLTDGTAFTNDADKEVDELTYTRNFTNTNWQALYVPFEMQYEDWKDDFELARINNVNQYDDNEDGDVDRTVLEVFKVKSGQTEAHTPYLIKAKTMGEKTISLSNATLYKAEEKSYDVSSWNTLYTFTGTYTGVSGATMFSEGYYALGSGSLHQAADATNALSPMRWYMAVTDRDGNPKNIGEVKVVVFGMEEDELIETGLEEVGRDAISTNEQPVFDLNGRRVTNPRKGLYIKNGKKLVIK